jgi:hypothetical protein
MQVASTHHFWNAGKWLLIMLAVAMAIAGILQRSGLGSEFSIPPAWGINLVVAWHLGRAAAESGARRWGVTCMAALGPPLSFFLFFRMWLSAVHE